MKYFEGCLKFYHVIIANTFVHQSCKHKPQEAEEDMRRASGLGSEVQLVDPSASKKLWKQAIRRFLYQCMYLLTPPNGLVSSYMQHNAISSATSLLGAEALQHLNFNLTLSCLSFLRLAFQLSERFTKYAFI